MKAIIVAAGLGTRFLPATKSIPKEMIPLAGKPLIQFLVEEAVFSGIKEIVFVISREKYFIKDHFRRSYKLERFLLKKKKHDLLNLIKSIHRLAKFRFTYQNEPLGNGHAVLCAKKFINKKEPVAVLFGDDIVDSKTPVIGQLLNAYEKYKKPVMALERVPWDKVSLYGVVRATPDRKGLFKITGIVEKPPRSKAPSNLTVVGKYILTPEALVYLERTKSGRAGEIGLAQMFGNMISAGEDIYGYEFRGKRFDCGDRLGYLEAQVHFGLKDSQLKNEFRRYLKHLI